MASTSGQREPGSFRDRRSTVFYRQGRVFRALDRQAASEWEQVASCQFMTAAMTQGEVIKTWPADEKPPSDGRWSMVLEHQKIPFISYPYEWSFHMLKDAALLHLDLLESALLESVITQDGTAFNVQWVGCQPVFIDTGSFVNLSAGSVWMGYRQFCQHFLFPLMLTAYRNVEFQPLLRGDINGLAVDQTNKLLSLRDCIRPGVLPHVVLQSRLQRRMGDSQRDVQGDLKQAGFGKQIILNNIKGLKKLVKRLAWDANESTWGDYTAMPHYDAQDRDAKAQFVAAALKSRQRRLVWDFGANTGTYSAVAAQYADYVVAADIDHLAVDRHYRKLKQSQVKNILPVVFDVAQPSPRLGWQLSERKAMEDRGQPDLILCLALVHHLVIGANIPMPQLIAWLAGIGADLVIEFVSRDDEMVKTLLRNRDDVFDDYQRDVFETALAAHFEVVSKLDLLGGSRTLFHCCNRAHRSEQ